MMISEHKPSKLGSLWPIAGAGLFMLVGILVLVYLGRDTARLINGPMPEIDLHPLLFVEQPLRKEDFEGKICVLHFWGTWSEPCRKSFPEFVDLYRHYESDRRVQIISVSCSQGVEASLSKLKEETQAFLELQGVEIPIYSDPAMFTRGSIARMLASGGFSYPFTLIVDSQGIVREYWLGDTPNTMPQLAMKIDQLRDMSLKP
jgi:alkyl hydroperoxide reductase subunit AhpC